MLSRAPFLVSTLSAVVIYVITISLVWMINGMLWAEYEAFDLNGDGFFTGAELTPEQAAAASRVTNDTGRALAPLTAGIFCFVYFLILYFLMMVKRWCKEIDEI